MIIKQKEKRVLKNWRWREFVSEHISLIPVYHDMLLNQ